MLSPRNGGPCPREPGKVDLLNATDEPPGTRRDGFRLSPKLKWALAAVKGVTRLRAWQLSASYSRSGSQPESEGRLKSWTNSTAGRFSEIRSLPQLAGFST